ncbi:MAG: sulfatase-like hydrolase/transferase [Bacteroidota bacterium]
MNITSILLALFFMTSTLSLQAQKKVENVFLITLDGLRWQEVFGGAVDSLIEDPTFTKDREDINTRFWAPNKEEARKKLMPFFWTTLVEQGQIHGNRWEKNRMNCYNAYWFSYPGYNEILTGFADSAINSNAKKYNQNQTILEIANQQEPFAGKVAAFGSWDVFPYIINDQRSGIPVNAGFRKAEGTDLSQMEETLNLLQDQVPSPWATVRLDAFTHHYMMEYVKKNHPRLVYISYGETDDFAHDGRYDHYLRSAYQTDQWIKAIWEYVQADPFYRNNTSLLITTDHGRGTSPMGEWKSHGTTIRDSYQIWMAAIGPNIPAKGEVKTESLLFQKQIAKTVMAMLGFDYAVEGQEVGEVIQSLFD